MKRLATLIAVLVLLTGCTPGEWERLRQKSACRKSWQMYDTTNSLRWRWNAKCEDHQPANEESDS